MLTETRCSFVGKASPVHFFWGGFDLAVTRFSGRPAPAREGPAFMREAYSKEVISHGFWPGGGQIDEAAFYAYAVPEPAGLKAVSLAAGAPATITPGSANSSCRTRPCGPRHRRSVLLPNFVASTYDAAATLARWDRAALER